MELKLNDKAHKGMTAMSKKMGAAGIFLAWLFYQCTAPDLQRVIVGSIVTILFIVVTLWREYIRAKYDPEAPSFKKSLMGRMSAALTMASGFLGGLLTSDISMEYKMWGGFSVVVVFLLAQGIYETMLATPNKETRALLGGMPPPPRKDEVLVTQQN